MNIILNIWLVFLVISSFILMGSLVFTIIDSILFDWYGIELSQVFYTLFHGE